MRSSVVDRIFYRAQKNKDIFLVTGDAGFGVLDQYRDRLPRRFLNLGVAEQNMISFSAGLALAGYKVFIYNIIPFLLYRCYEQVRNDICYQRLPITLVGIGSGVTYAPLGVTHYSIEDIALARTMPNLVILSPSDPVEAVACADYALRAKTPVFIRLAKTGEPVLHSKPIKDILSPIVVQSGRGVAVIFHGSVSCEVMAALMRIKQKPLVISMPCLSPINDAALKKHLRGIGRVITVEEHFIDGGLGTIIIEWAARNNVSIEVEKMGITNEFIHSIKNNSGMREHYGIDAAAIENKIKEFFNG